MAEAAVRLARRAQERGGTLIVTGSPRTDPAVLAAIEAAVAPMEQVVVRDRHSRFPVLMNDAAEIFVTADSFAMISEAVLTGKPVGLIPVSLNATGRRWLGDEAKVGGKRRDMRRVWDDLAGRGWIGTMDEPRAAKADNPTDAAAARVLRLLEG